MICICCLTTVGCRSLQPTVGINTSTDTNHVKTDYRHDTIIIDRLHEVIRGADTVYVRDSVIVVKYKYVHKTDTLHISKTDTITVTNTVIEEKQIGSPFIYKSGIALWVVLGILLLLAIIWLVWKLAKGKIPGLGILSKIFKLVK